MRKHHTGCLLALGLALVMSASQACSSQDFEESVVPAAAGSGGQLPGLVDAAPVSDSGSGLPVGPKPSCIPSYCFPMDGKLNCLPILCLIPSITNPSPVGPGVSEQ